MDCYASGKQIFTFKPSPFISRVRVCCALVKLSAQLNSLVALIVLVFCAKSASIVCVGIGGVAFVDMSSGWLAQA